MKKKMGISPQKFLSYFKKWRNCGIEGRLCVTSAVARRCLPVATCRFCGDVIVGASNPPPPNEFDQIVVALLQLATCKRLKIRAFQNKSLFWRGVSSKQIILIRKKNTKQLKAFFVNVTFIELDIAVKWSCVYLKKITISELLHFFTCSGQM